MLLQNIISEITEYRIFLIKYISFNNLITDYIILLTQWYYYSQNDKYICMKLMKFFKYVDIIKRW